ncbi:MAG: cache domain-containing protein [Bacteroidales bacterium]|nr:cache domain-containing protein [Bacteroidales bacterium]
MNEYFKVQLNEKYDEVCKVEMKEIDQLSLFVNRTISTDTGLKPALTKRDYSALVTVAEHIHHVTETAGYIVADPDGIVVHSSFYGWQSKDHSCVSDFIDYLNKAKSEIYNGYMDVFDIGHTLMTAHAVKDSNGTLAAYLIVYYVCFENENYLKRSGATFGLTPSVFRGRMGVASAIQAGTENAGKKFKLFDEAIGDTVLNTGHFYHAEADFQGRKYYSVYTPLTDYAGRNTGIYNIAIDVTEMKEVAVAHSVKLFIICSLVNIVLTILLIISIKKNLISPIHTICESIRSITNGHLNIKVPMLHNNKEVETLTECVQNMHKSLSMTYEDMVKTANLFSTTSSTLSAVSKRLSADIAKQKSYIEKITSNLSKIKDEDHQQESDNISTAVENMFSTVKNSDYYSDEINSKANDLSQAATKLQKIIDLFKSN